MLYVVSAMSSIYFICFAARMETIYGWIGYLKPLPSMFCSFLIS